MKLSSQLLENAVDSLTTLPGIGKKTALRLALFLIDQEIDNVSRFTDDIMKLRKEIKHCEQCFNLSDETICSICSSKSRNQEVICVVETIKDILAIEETSQFNGVYHVLGGIINPIEGIGPDDLNIGSLVQRIDKNDISELIMAISPTIEGDTTIYYLSNKLQSKVKISTIARGVSFGGELEYADGITLGRSILARTPYNAQ